MQDLNGVRYDKASTFGGILRASDLSHEVYETGSELMKLIKGREIWTAPNTDSVEVTNWHAAFRMRKLSFMHENKGI